jgi:hypothetical protein
LSRCWWWWQGQSSGGRFEDETLKPEDIKPLPGVEDPRMEENSPSTVGGIVRRYTNKTVEVRHTHTEKKDNTAAARFAQHYRHSGLGFMASDSTVGGTVRRYTNKTVEVRQRQHPCTTQSITADLAS